MRTTPFCLESENLIRRAIYHILKCNILRFKISHAGIMKTLNNVSTIFLNDSHFFFNVLDVFHRTRLCVREKIS